MKIEMLQRLYLHELRVLYSSEQQIKNALPRAIRAANCPDLKAALKSHLHATKKHLARLDEIFASHPEVHMEGSSAGVSGLLQEYQGFLDVEEDGELRDLGMIAKWQRIEHYEIAGYATVRAYAEQLGYYDEVALLTETLEEESAMDDELTSAAILLLCECPSPPSHEPAPSLHGNTRGSVSPSVCAW